MGRPRTTRTASVPALGAATLTLAMTATALGYAGETPTNATMTTVGEIEPGTPISLSATVLGPSGTGVPDVTVTFTLTDAPPGSDDTLSSPASGALQDANAMTVLFIPDQPTEAGGVAALGDAATDVTDAEGVATVTLTLDAVVGSRTITATAEGNVLGSITIVLQADGLPNTASAAREGATNPLPLALLGAAGTIAVLGLRRHARRLHRSRP